MRFIVLTWKNGDKIRYNINHIVSYYLDEGSTIIELADGGVQYVRETPEEIDTILINNGILVHAKDN